MSEALEKIRQDRLTRERKEFVSDWIAEIADNDNGKVFWESTPDSAVSNVTYGDLRRLMRQDSYINEESKP